MTPPAPTAAPPVDAPARRPAIDPRIRARRISVRRAAGRRRLWRLIALGAVLAVLAAAALATRTPLLDVDRIEIVGAAHTPVAEVQAASGVEQGQQMVDVDLADAREGVAALPWVATVSVRRHWPGTLRITLTERAALAAVPRTAGFWMLADSTGRLLEEAATPPPGVVPLGGVDTAGVPGDQLAGAALDALRIVQALPTDAVAQIGAVVAAPEGIQLQLGAGGVVWLGPAADLDDQLLAAQMEALLTVLTTVALDCLAVLDLRVPATPVLTRGSGCANVSTQTGG